MAKITGIEIDGRHVRVVRTNGSVISSYDEITAATIEDALAETVKKHGKPGADTVVAWSGRTYVRPVELPDSPDSILPSVIRDVAPQAMSTTGMVISGVVSGPVDGLTRPGMIGAADIDALSPVYKAFGNKVRLLLSAFCFTADGVYLAVRASGVEMSQVENGYLNAARTLDVEGIDTLALALKEPGAVPADVLDDYGERVVHQVRETLRQWARDQRTSSSNNVLYIHGVGEDVPGLRQRLQDETAKQILNPPVPGVDLSAVNGKEHRATQALFAATSGAANLPAVWLKNPINEQAKQEKRQKEKQRRNTMVIAAAVAGVIAFMGYPLVGARNNLDAKRSDYNTARAAFANLVEPDRLGFQVNDYETQIEALEGAEPNWEAVMDFILTRTPPTVIIDRFSAILDGRTVMLDVTMRDETVTEAFLSPEEWATNLIRDLAIPGTFPRDLAIGDDGVVGSFMIPLPDDTRFFHSSRNEDPTLTEEATTTSVDETSTTSTSTEASTSTTSTDDSVTPSTGSTTTTAAPIRASDDSTTPSTQGTNP